MVLNKINYNHVHGRLATGIVITTAVRYNLLFFGNMLSHDMRY